MVPIRWSLVAHRAVAWQCSD